MSASGSSGLHQKLIDDARRASEIKVEAEIVQDPSVENSERLVVGGCNQYLRACAGKLWSVVRRARRAPVGNQPERTPEQIEQGLISNSDSLPKQSEDKAEPNRNALNPTVIVPITASVFAILLQLEILSKDASVSPYLENKRLMKSSYVALVLMALSSVLVGFTKGKIRTCLSIATYICSALTIAGPSYVVLYN